MKKRNYNRSRPSADAMKIEKLILATAAVCLLIGVPLGLTLRKHAMQLKRDVNHRRELESKIESVQHELDAKSHEVGTKASEVQDLTNEKTRLEKELKDQAAAKKATLLAQVARAAQDTQPAQQSPAVVVSVSSGPISCKPPYSDGGNPKAAIYFCESGNNPAAVNSTGCRGLGQACPGTKLTCGVDYACQDAWFSAYMVSHGYGTWAAAWAFWIRTDCRPYCGHYW